ncbi:hypothetical protein KC571_00015 [candidate division WWE3 bacterium]|uniref:Uncharacterized protein n=1 Tax=candidate division WWE3 bacterium TaxID=2053526 RepID=A0A955RNX2_UNCKA|nr:hypothetical protein [candidate division WWE3 bacterium]
MALNKSQILFGPDLTLTEAEDLMSGSKPIRLLIAADKQHGFAIAWNAGSTTVNIGWGQHLTGPFLMAKVKPLKRKERRGRGSQNRIEKLFRFLNKFEDTSFIHAMHGILEGLPPRVGTIPNVTMRLDLVEMAKFLGLSPYKTVEQLIEAGLQGGFSLEELSVQLELGPDVVIDFEMDPHELAELWKLMILAQEDAARGAAKITPYHAAISLGFGDLVRPDVTAEEVVALIRQNK